MRDTMLTIFKLLKISGLDKLWFNRLKPPEQLSDKHHHIELDKKKSMLKHLTAEEF